MLRRSGLVLIGLLVLVLVLVTACLVGCSVARLPDPNKSMGERFDAWLKERDDWCRKEGIGPYLDKTKPGWQDKARYSSCEILKLKPWDPNETEASRFAHSIKLPPPHDQVKWVYRPGMTAAQYFAALCREEAGEFIFRSVDNVEGIYQLRTVLERPEGYVNHLYAYEDPFDEPMDRGLLASIQYLAPLRYSYFERMALAEPRKPLIESWMDTLHPSMTAVPPTGAVIERYFGYDGSYSSSLRKVFDQGRRSRYGYTWRGIRRPHDRELGIAGGELIVLDLQTNEVLGYRRGFIMAEMLSGGRAVLWRTQMDCQGIYHDRRDFNYSFIGRVLRTKDYAASIAEVDRKARPLNVKPPHD